MNKKNQILLVLKKTFKVKPGAFLSFWRKDLANIANIFTIIILNIKIDSLEILPKYKKSLPLTGYKESLLRQTIGHQNAFHAYHQKDFEVFNFLAN